MVDVLVVGVVVAVEFSTFAVDVLVGVTVVALSTFEVDEGVVGVVVSTFRRFVDQICDRIVGYSLWMLGDDLNDDVFRRFVGLFRSFVGLFRRFVDLFR